MEKHSKETPGVAPVPAGTPTHGLQGRTFIGGKSQQFQASAPRQRAQIAASAGEPELQPKTEETAPEVETACPSCDGGVGELHLFCPTCGTDLNKSDMSKALGIELTEDDVSEYLFKGYLVKEVPLIRGKVALFKTLTSAEAEAVETSIMDKFKDKDATNSQWANSYAITSLSHGWIKFDGQSLGSTPEDRHERLNTQMGVHLIDIASKKWNMFNRAVGSLLEDPDKIKN
ncbi:MAG: hypothetical protein ACYTBJ_17385 [Planctomycetota bacterium]|jgi:hypothetical protein